MVIMLVYRIEHKETGFGPYQNNGTWPTDLCETLKMAHDDNNHPSPWDDSFEDGKRGRISPDQICGLDSLDSFIEWFNGWFEALKDHGFVCQVYEVEPDCVSTWSGQVLFKATKAVMVDVIEL